MKITLKTFYDFATDIGNGMHPMQLRKRIITAMQHNRKSVMDFTMRKKYVAKNSGSNFAIESQPILSKNCNEFATAQISVAKNGGKWVGDTLRWICNRLELL